MVLEVVKPGWVDGEDFPIFSVDIHPQGNKFATGGQGSDCGRIVIWNMEPIRHQKLQDDPTVHKQLCQMENHLACVNCVRWSGDGKYLASAGDDKLVMLWTRNMYGGGAVFGGGGKVNHESYRCAHTLRQHDGDVLDLAWGPGDKWLASASVDNSVIVWDVSGIGSPTSVAVLRGHTGHVKGVTWDPVGKYIASQSADKTLRVWRTGDWKEEAVVKEPFQDCGGTTHVLRLDWSPDGQYLVSAHAMNGGGPTAQIIERDGFKFEKDFVGHRKAVTCIRFNSNIFQRKSSKGSGNYACVAIGSRDRSVSVWLTSLKRPLFVCHDLFESSILDLAWSKDGMTLIACSMDGHIASFNFSGKDIGTPMSISDKNQLFKKLYGRTSGIAVADKPVLIENAELLKLNSDSDALGDFSDTFTDKSSTWSPIKGPTDKQIEVKTSDGRRRITPMFIPPTLEGDWSRNSTMSSDGTMVMGRMISSSSSEPKSRIKFERRDGVVEPNVSPGKKEADVKKDAEAKKEPEVIKPNMIPVKRKVGNVMVQVTTSVPSSTTSTVTATAPAVSIGTTSHSLSNGLKTKVEEKTKKDVNEEKGKGEKDEEKGKGEKDDHKDKEKEKDDEKIKGKKPSNRIESSSDSSDSDSSDSDSSESSSDDDETAGSQTEKSGKSETEDKKKTSLVSSVVGSKRKGEDLSTQHPAKKRGRPVTVTGPSRSRETDSGQSTPVTKHIEVVAAPAPVVQPVLPLHPQLVPASPTRAYPGLPPLTIPRNPYYLQAKAGDKVLHVHVQNEYEKYVGGYVHRTAVHTGESASSSLLWESLFTAPVAGVVCGGNLVVIVCKDATIHIFNTDGSRALPVLSLPAPPHKLKSENALVTCVTTSGRMFLWNMAGVPIKAVLSNLEISPLNKHTTPRTSVSISSIKYSGSDPVLCLSDGSSHTYSQDIGCWLQLTHSRQALSLSTAMSKGPPATLPLASLSSTPSGMSKLDAVTGGIWTISVIETRLSSSIYLKSSQEYRYWLLSLVKQLTLQGQEARLRCILDDLLASTCRANSVGSNAELLGLKRDILFKEMLPLLGSNLTLQRLYTEYRNHAELKKTGSVDLFS